MKQVDEILAGRAEGITEQVASLAKDGFGIVEIADALDLSPNNVSTHLTRARRQGTTVPRFSKRMIALPEDLRAKLEIEAADRGMEGSTLVRHLLKAVVDSGLVGLLLSRKEPRVEGD